MHFYKTPFTSVLGLFLISLAIACVVEDREEVIDDEAALAVARSFTATSDGLLDEAAAPSSDRRDAETLPAGEADAECTDVESATGFVERADRVGTQALPPCILQSIRSGICRHTDFYFNWCRDTCEIYGKRWCRVSYRNVCGPEHVTRAECYCR